MIPGAGCQGAIVMNRPARDRHVGHAFIILNVGLCTLLFGLLAPAVAQTPTPDPSAWRPVSYADLQRPDPTTGTYAEIWQDVIFRNNTAYADRGDHRFVGGNAPVTEAHFVIWSARKAVVLSVLDTATGCTLLAIRPAAHATIKKCPVRLAIYEGALVQTLSGGLGCYLELEPTAVGGRSDLDRAVAYASYDPAIRTVHTGLVIDHEAVEGCSQDIPLPAS